MERSSSCARRSGNRIHLDIVHARAAEAHCASNERRTRTSNRYNIVARERRGMKSTEISRGFFVVAHMQPQIGARSASTSIDERINCARKRKRWPDCCGRQCIQKNYRECVVRTGDERDNRS
jgi:hypothetical protein